MTASAIELLFKPQSTQGLHTNVCSNNGCILFVFISSCVFGKDQNTPYKSSKFDDAITSWFVNLTDSLTSMKTLINLLLADLPTL